MGPFDDLIPDLVFGKLPDDMSEEEKNLMNHHRRNLINNTAFKDDYGTTTVNVVGVDGPDGRIYNIPAYEAGAWDKSGRPKDRSVLDKAAKDMANRDNSWSKYPSFGSDEGPKSDISAQKLHKFIEKDMEVFQKPYYQKEK